MESTYEKQFYQVLKHYSETYDNSPVSEVMTKLGLPNPEDSVSNKITAELIRKGFAKGTEEKDAILLVEKGRKHWNEHKKSFER